MYPKIQFSRCDPIFPQWAANGKTEQRHALRAKIILGLHEGKSNKEVARLLGISEVIVCKWRKRFVWQRLDGLRDAIRSGRKAIYGDKERVQVLKQTLEKPQESRWTVRALAESLKEKVGISKSRINDFFRQMDLKPHQIRSWLESKDPEFEQKMVAVCGLYIDPPQNALVVSVDEKPCIQAKGRKTPDKPMRPGSPAKRDFEYVRHGTVDLFAALLVHEGKVIGMPSARHTAQDFLAFLETLNKQLPKDVVIHLVLDNLSTHMTAEVNAWFEQHGRWERHFVPTHSSWLNQVEIWFSILSKKQLKDGIFHSKQELVTVIMDFIKRYNETGKPFKWTYKGGSLDI